MPKLPPPPIDLLDSVYLQSSIDNAEKALGNARFDLDYFAKEIESLSTQINLPANYQNAYRRIHDVIRGAFTCIEEAQEQLSKFEMEASDLLHGQSSELLPEEVAIIGNVISEINSAEGKLLDEAETITTFMQSMKAESSIIDWSSPFEYQFTLLLEPGPERAFYKTCGDGDEPLRIALDFYPLQPSKEDREYDWYSPRNFSDHPSDAFHVGYLAHSIMDHTRLPIQLLPHIAEIEVKIAFADFETAWINQR